MFLWLTLNFELCDFENPLKNFQLDSRFSPSLFKVVKPIKNIVIFPHDGAWNLILINA